MTTFLTNTINDGNVIERIFQKEDDMNLIINKTLTLNGQVIVPGSKSQSIRAIMLASLCEGESTLINTLHSDDTQDAINVCRSLGAKISESGHALTIKSMGLPLKLITTEIHSGNSGVTTHFVMPILGLRENADQPIILNCGEQMRARPVKPLVEALTRLGLSIKYLENNNTLPISISGALKGGKTYIDGMSSQYLSALLFALPCAPFDSEINVKNLQERPYAEMTLEWLKNQGILFHHLSTGNLDTYNIKGGQSYKNICATIPGDFSSASYLIAASVLIPGEVILQGLNMADPQGDKQLVGILQKMGADIVIHPTHLRIRGGKRLSGIKIDANDIPDLLPTLAVVGTYASGKTEIYNVAHARIKETDRIQSMAKGLTNMGAKIDEQDDGLIIYQSALKGAPVKGYGDHRTVMALSIAGMIADGETIIDDGEAIHKTFPTFITIMQSLGANMEVESASSS